MGVRGDGKTKVGVAYHILQNARVYALQHKPGGVCMPEIVQPVRRCDARCFLCRAPSAPQRFGRDRDEIGRWKQEAHGSCEDWQKLRRDRHDAHTSGRLRRRGDDLAADTDALTLDTYQPGFEVDVSAPETQHFPTPQPRKASQREGHAFADDRCEKLPVCALDGAALLALVIGLVNGFDRALPDMAAADGAAKCRMQQRIDELRLSAAGCFLGADDGRLNVVRRDRFQLLFANDWRFASAHPARIASAKSHRCNATNPRNML